MMEDFVAISFFAAIVFKNVDFHWKQIHHKHKKMYSNRIPVFKKGRN